MHNELWVVVDSDWDPIVWGPFSTEEEAPAFAKEMPHLVWDVCQVQKP